MTFLQVTSQIAESTEEEVTKVTEWADELGDMAVTYIPKIVGAILIYIIGAWLIKWVSRLLRKVFKNRKLDQSLQTFLVSVVRISLIILLIITVISMLGVNVTSFAALLAGAGLAIGSALNGSLGNLAGGVMILLLRPFRVGDLIEAQEKFGIVTEIGIVYTTVLTSQNKTIRLPNGALSTGVITNYTDQENLRIDIKVPILDKTDFEKAKSIAVEAMKTHPLVIEDPAPNARIVELTGDGPVLVLWPRIKIKKYDPENPREMEADYYSIFFGIRERVYAAFVANDIQTPDTTIEAQVFNHTV